MNGKKWAKKEKKREVRKGEKKERRVKNRELG